MTDEVKRCEICNLTHQYLYGTPTGYVHAECLDQLKIVDEYMKKRNGK